ncbi:MAG TPA: hypothetical protein VGN57_17010 [Pirellulaceae bacterium]|jgi:hypothetical protein|nr:hypothetical protein [Pirellulaceae bacterium]
MNGLLRFACFAAALCCGIAARAEEAPETPFQRRIREAGIQKAMESAASTLMATGHAPSSANARETLRNRYWAFQKDVELAPEQLRDEEAKFERAFSEVAQAAAERKLRTVALVGMDDVASPVCVRWHFLSLAGRGPALFRIVLVRSEGGAKVLRFDVLTDLDEVEAAMNAIEIPGGEKKVDITWIPGDEPAPTTSLTLAP